jgi:hypothetical protein
MIKAGIGDLVQRTVDGQAQVEYLMIERLRCRVTLCVVYTVHKEMRSVSFLVELQNHHWVFRFVPQNRRLRFVDLSIKITTMVFFLFEPQK